jgi:hypothetical protein
MKVVRELAFIVGIVLLGTAGVGFARFGEELLWGSGGAYKVAMVAVVFVAVGAILYWAAHRLWSK